MEKVTALFSQHLKHKGKMVTYADYALPVQYEQGVIAEHLAVRMTAGIFDVSHMGEFLISGEQAGAYLDLLLTNKIQGMESGQIRYSLMCYPDGSIVDDLLVYCFKENDYMLVVNAANHDKDWEWVLEHKLEKVELKDASEQISQIALQGPFAISILSKLVEKDLIPEKYYRFNAMSKIQGIECLISRNGYTGEDGVEIYLKNDDANEMYELLMNAGADFGLLPCGLAARDTLRLEASMPLYGHEMSDSISPLEIGLKTFVKLDKVDFIGKDALSKQVVTRKRIGLKIIDRGIARENYPVFIKDEQIGYVTSGTMVPYLNQAIAMALVDIEKLAEHTEVEVDCRNRRLKAEIIAMPFYRRNK